jgi:phosphohistidine phosphatase
MPGPYELYLVRHAVAEERADKWPDDTKRPLTAEGSARMKKAARGLERLGVTLDVILSSPLVRARQTAEILSARLDGHPPIVNSEALAPGGTYAALVADLEKQSRKTRIALVGHEPAMGELAARLIGARRAIDLKKGAIVRIDVDALPPTGGDLRWLLTTRVLKAIRR